MRVRDRAPLFADSSIHECIFGLLEPIYGALARIWSAEPSGNTSNIH